MGYSGLGYQMQYMNLQQRELLRICTGFPFKRFPEEKHTNERPKDKRRPKLFWDADPHIFGFCQAKRRKPLSRARSCLQFSDYALLN